MNTEERLAKLEAQNACFARANRRLRFAVTALAILVGAGFLAGMNASAPDELTLRKLTIVDVDGRERIKLIGMDDQLNAGMWLLDKKGLVRISSTINCLEDATQSLYDGSGKQRIVMVSSGERAAGMAHFDGEHDTPRITVGLEGDDFREVHYDEKGQQRILIAVRPDSAVIGQNDHSGSLRFSTGTRIDGMAFATQMDAKGEARFRFVTMPDGTAEAQYTSVQAIDK